MPDIWFAPTQTASIQDIASLTLPASVSHLQLYSWKIDNRQLPIIPLQRPLVIESGAVKAETPDASAHIYNVSTILSQGWPLMGVSMDEPLSAITEHNLDYRTGVIGTRAFIRAMRGHGLLVGMIEAVPFLKMAPILQFIDDVGEAIDWLHLDADPNWGIRYRTWYGRWRTRRHTWPEINVYYEEAEAYCRPNGILLGAVCWPGGGSNNYEQSTIEMASHIAPMADRQIIQTWERDDLDLASQVRRIPLNS